MTDLTAPRLPLRSWSRFEWEGVVARPAGDGWTGSIVPRIAPHPLSLGRAVFAARGRGAPLDPPAPDSDEITEDGECSARCQPPRARWVYVVSDTSLTVLASACFDSGPGMVSDEHHFRHVPVGTFRLDGPEPDWEEIARRALALKTGPSACPKQRIAL